MNKNEIKKLKYLQAILNNKLGRLKLTFSYKLNMILLILNIFVLFTHFLKIFVVSEANSIGFIEAFSHDDTVPLFSWMITSIAILMTAGATFTNREYFFKNILKIKIFFQHLFSMQGTYKYFIANKDIFFPLFQHHVQRDKVLVDTLEILKNNGDIPTSTAQFMLHAIDEKLSSSSPSTESSSYNVHVQEVNKFFKSEQDIQFFSEKEKQTTKE